MPRIKIFFLISVLLISSASAVVPSIILAKGGTVHVSGYYKKNGTYVAPYVKTAPDGNPFNNYSYPGNYNPNTGEITPGNPDTYLKNYYKYDTYTPSTNYSAPDFSSLFFPPTYSSSSQISIPSNSCGSNSHTTRQGCECDVGYANGANGCTFVSCPLTYKLIDMKCEISSAASNPSQQVKCLTKNPCRCLSGYVPLANRVCIPQ